MHTFITVMISLWTFAQLSALFGDIRNGKGSGWVLHLVFAIASVVALLGHVGALT